LFAILREKDDLISTYLVRSESVVSSVNSDPNMLKYYALTVTVVVIVGVIAYFYFKNNPGPSEPNKPSYFLDEIQPKLSVGMTQIDLQTISAERAEILNKLNELSEKSVSIGLLLTKIEDNNKILSGKVLSVVSNAENARLTEKLNTLMDQQTVIHAGMRQVMSSNLGFIDGTKRIFGELTTDRHGLNTTLKELAKKQALLENNQHDLSKNQNDIEIARGIMEHAVELHDQNIAFLNENAQNCSDQLTEIKQSFADMIKLIGDLSS